MPFQNKIRLPFKITRSQFKAERNVFRKADGSFKTMSAIVSKTMEGETDWLPEKWHERLQIAMNHDTVTIEGDKYLGGISPEGDYDIEWTDFLDYPIAKAKFKVNVTPFAASNHNCQTCEEATQLDLTNDIFKDAYDENLLLEEETAYQINVAANDEICCYPAVFSITSFNTAYLTSATITQAGLLSILVKNSVVDADNVPLVTYRVACPNGGYDEAIVYGDINGSVAGCLNPDNVTVIVAGNTAEVTIDAPSPPPDNGYLWQLYIRTNPGVVVQSGTTTDLVFDINDLDYNTLYEVWVRSDCAGVFSEWVLMEFDTPVQSNTCGQYSLTYYSTLGVVDDYDDVTYLNCLNEYETVRVFHAQTHWICTRQSSSGNPDSVYGSSSTGVTEITYIDLC